MQEKKGLQYRQVSHQDHEYAKSVATTAKGLSGTQCMDRWWRSQKTFVPSCMNRKSTSDDGESVLHPNIDTYLYQWVWRERALKGMGPQERMELVSALF